MRKAKPKKRVVLPDPVYGDVKVTKFVNNLMYDGKKSVAYTIFYTALKNVENKMKNEEKSPLEIWKKALENVTPQVEVKSRRIGGATFQDRESLRSKRCQHICCSLFQYGLKDFFLQAKGSSSLLSLNYQQLFP